MEVMRFGAISLLAGNFIWCVNILVIHQFSVLIN